MGYREIIVCCCFKCDMELTQMNCVVNKKLAIIWRRHTLGNCKKLGPIPKYLRRQCLILYND